MNPELEEKPNRFSSPTPFPCLGCSAFGRRQRGITRARRGALVASGRRHRPPERMKWWKECGVVRSERWPSTDLTPPTRSGWRRVRRPGVRRPAVGRTAGAGWRQGEKHAARGAKTERKVWPPPGSFAFHKDHENAEKASSNCGRPPTGTGSLPRSTLSAPRRGAPIGKRKNRKVELRDYEWLTWKETNTEFCFLLVAHSLSRSDYN